MAVAPLKLTGACLSLPSTAPPSPEGSGSLMLSTAPLSPQVSTASSLLAGRPAPSLLQDRNISGRQMKLKATPATPPGIHRPRPPGLSANLATIAPPPGLEALGPMTSAGVVDSHSPPSSAPSSCTAAAKGAMQVAALIAACGRLRDCAAAETAEEAEVGPMLFSHSLEAPVEAASRRSWPSTVA